MTKLLGEVSERTGCKMLLAQKAFSNYDCYRFLSHILQAQRPVDYLRHDSEQRKCREKRFMYSVQATGLMNLKNFFNMRIISCLIHHRSSSFWCKGKSSRKERRIADQSGMFHSGRT